MKIMWWIISGAVVCVACTRTMNWLHVEYGKWGDLASAILTIGVISSFFLLDHIEKKKAS